MKRSSGLLCLLCGSLGTGWSAQASAPVLLGSPVTAVEAVPVPETVVLEALSDDGRWLLMTSASGRLVGNDFNSAADVFLLDRASTALTLVSTTAEGRPANGTSVGSGISADGGHLVFLSRGSDLTSPDDNETWDVFVRNGKDGTNRPITVGENGSLSSGPASEARISTDGRFVIFRSAARDFAPGALLSTDNLYRRDLVAGVLECITTNLPVDPQSRWRLKEWTLTPDALAVALVVNAEGSIGPSNVVVWRNLATGLSVNCPDAMPPERTSLQFVQHSAPTLSANGRFVAFRSRLEMDGVSRYALNLHDTEQGTTALLAMRTNNAFWQIFPESALIGSVSRDGRFVAYSAPWPVANHPGPDFRTNGLSQVYLCDTHAVTTRLVSVAPDGVSPADADAFEARVTPDGHEVYFITRASNMLPATSEPSFRLYRWERETGTLRVAAELGVQDPAGRFLMSHNGEFVATVTSDPTGVATIFYPESRDAAAQSVPLMPVAEQSATSRGWIGVQPAGVSAAGRYVALTAFPPGPPGDTNHMQVYLHDTESGLRQPIGLGIDGNFANRHSAAPSISADGSKILFHSQATNLTAADGNDTADFFAHTVPTAERTALLPRPTPVPVSPSALAQRSCLISPDGSSAFLTLTYREVGLSFSWLAKLPNGEDAKAFSGAVLGLPSFSQDGKTITVSVFPDYLGTRSPRIEVRDVAAWLAAGEAPAPPLWTSAVQAVEPILSADGRRVAYFHKRNAPAATNAVVVVDVAQDLTLFSHPLGGQVPASLGLSANGRFLVWVSSGAQLDSPNQVWRANVDNGEVKLVSVASDGFSEGNHDSGSSTISADGHYVAFCSRANNLSADDTNESKDVFLRDTLTKETLLVSRGTDGGAASGWSLPPFFSANGRSLFFLSHAPNLATDDLNQGADLFKVQILEESTVLAVLQLGLDANHVRLLWNGAPDEWYRIEFKDDIAQSGWTPVPGSFSGNTAVELGTTDSAHRFFRIVHAPQGLTIRTGVNR